MSRFLIAILTVFSIHYGWCMEIDSNQIVINKLYDLTERLSDNDGIDYTCTDHSTIQRPIKDGHILYDIYFPDGSIDIGLYKKNPEVAGNRVLTSSMNIIITEDDASVIYLNFIKTVKKFRFQGHATTLLNHLEWVAKAAHCSTITLRAYNHLEHFYTERGYEKTPTCNASSNCHLIPMHKHL